MILNPVNIVGCGTLGACLALRLAKEKLVSELNIYDFDVISDKPSYPFLKQEHGLHKIKLIEFLCRKLNPFLVIKTYLERIVTPLNFESFTIDCRDSKDSDIRAKIRVSLDGYILYVNSMITVDTSKDYHRYLAPRDEIYINKSIDVIIDYLKNNEYIYQDYKLYDLSNNDSCIIKREVHR